MVSLNFSRARCGGWGQQGYNMGRAFSRLLKRMTLCLFGFHDRSRARARYDGLTWHSRCKNCEVAMVRLDSGDWIVSKGDVGNPQV